eukprot:3838280-Pyramimonas_sp.AAC.1
MSRSIRCAEPKGMGVVEPSRRSHAEGRPDLTDYGTSIGAPTATWTFEHLEPRQEQRRKQATAISNTMTFN